MDSKNILTVALKIGAIVIFVNVLSQFPSFYSDYLAEGVKAHRFFILFTVIPSAFSVLISILLWFFPKFFLNNVLAHEKVDSEKYSDETSIAPALIGIIGLYILVTAIADISYHISFVYEGRKILGAQFELTHQNKAEILATVVEIILGGVLIFGGNIFSRLISRLRLELKKDSL